MGAGAVAELRLLEEDFKAGETNGAGSTAQVSSSSFSFPPLPSRAIISCT